MTKLTGWTLRMVASAVESVFIFSAILLPMSGCNEGPSNHPQDTDTDTSDDTDPAVCEEAPALPASSQIWLSDTSQQSAARASFAMDGDGNLVFVDISGNLIKRDAKGKSQIWIKDAAKNAASLAILSTGEAVIADSGIASLVKLHPSGARTVLLSGLDQPGGMDIDLNDDIYVIERLSNTIRRVNPETKVSGIIAKNMETTPGGISFSPDYQTLYFSGTGDGTLWALRRNEDETFGAPEKFGSVPGSADPCIGKTAEEACGFMGINTGTCTPIEDGSLYCQKPDPCINQDEGDECQDERYDKSGICRKSSEGDLYCDPILPCTDKKEGDECIISSESNVYEAEYDVMMPWSGTGICEAHDTGVLVCRATTPCEGKNENDSCNLGWGESGICVDYGGYLECEYIEPCSDSNPGDSCTTYSSSPGVCIDDGDFYCAPIGTCEGKEEGQSCSSTDLDENGLCTLIISGILYCRPIQPCDGKGEGDDCITDWGGVGRCVSSGTEYTDTDGGEDTVSEAEPLALTDTNGEDEIDEMVMPDTDPGSSGLYCREINSCEGKVDGDPCTTPWGTDGRCVDYGSSTDMDIDMDADTDTDTDTDTDIEVSDISYLDESNLDISDSVDMNADIDTGVDADADADTDLDSDSDIDYISCEEIPPCEGLQAGDTCSYSDDEVGICIEKYPGYLYCQVIRDCDTAEEGDTCHETGTCTSDLNSGFYCQETKPCENSAAGDSCFDDDYWLEGTCAERNDGGVYCETNDPCRDAVRGDACAVPYQGIAGTCEAGDTDRLYCRQQGLCDGKSAGDSCTTKEGYIGSCVDYGEGYLYCEITWTCSDMSEGDACTMGNGDPGICTVQDNGELSCETPPVCFGQEKGAPCEGPFNTEGTCEIGASGEPLCVVPSTCEGKKEHADCLDLETGAEGTCELGAFGTKICRAVMPCDAKNAGDICTAGPDSTGTCIAVDQSETLWCYTGFKQGILNGINTDICGNVYVMDSQSDALWRFPPTGDTPFLAAFTMRTGITQLSWAQGNDNWSDNTLYLGVDGGKELVAVPLGIPGRPRNIPGSATAPEPVSDTAFDCLHIPKEPVSVTELGEAKGYHDVAFDNEGYIVGHNGSTLVRVNADNISEVFASGVNYTEGMDWLPDGSLVAATEDGLMRIYPNGAKTIIASDIFAYSVIVGPDGMIYAGDNNRVYRVNPDTNDKEIFINPSDFNMSLSPRGVDFDPDFTLMYMTTLGQSQIYAVALDEDMNPVGAPRLFAVIPGSGYQDGLGVDICGNLYVPVYEQSALYRITPDGQVTKIVQFDSDKYGHGLEWGSGLGGFNENSLYLPQPYDNYSVVEVNIGVPSRRSTAQAAAR